MTNYIKTESGLLVPFAPAILKRNYVEGGAGSRLGLSGEFRMEVRRADGSLKYDSGWFNNLILDSGLNRIGTANIVGGCAIGTNSTPPTTTQTALAARSAWTTTQQASSTSQAQASAPYYRSNTRTYRFALGALNGNYSEVGVGWGPDNMFSRALILNDVGVPTPLTVLSDEQLDVTYRLRQYIPTTDWGGTYTIGGASYAVTGRPASITSSGGPGDPFSTPWTPVSGGAASYAIAYSGAIGAITGWPSGTSSSVESSSNIANAAYSNNSMSRSATVTWTLNVGNVAGGVSAVAMYGDSTPFVQYGFNPPIPKNNTRTLALTFSLSWARRP